MREFIRLQLKLKWGLNRNNGKTSAVMTSLATLFAVAIALALVWVLSVALKTSIPELSAKRLAVLYLTLLMAGLTVAATGMQIKRLYRPADLAITARFPLSPFKLFIGYLILNYIDLCIYSAVFFLPVMLVFGFAMGCIGSYVYLLGILLGVILLPLLPFALSVFIAIPAVYAMGLLEKHGILRLLLFAIFLTGAFCLYYYVLTELSHFFLHRDWQEGTLDIWRGLLAGLDSYYNPAYYLGNAIFFERFWLGFGVLFGGSAVLIAGGVALARVVCSNFRNRALESGTGSFTRHSVLDNYGNARAIFRHEFKEILRSKTYSYFYLGVAISTPVMVFFCNELVRRFGEAQIGVGINFGASMLVIAVFMAMISSFAGTILSVEGKNFYITKLVPVSYRKQLLIKGLLNVAVSTAALLISTVVIAILKFVSAAELSVIFFSQFLLAVGFVFNGINLNLANPTLKPKANGEAEEINITYMLLIGFVIAAILGAFSIILPKSAVWKGWSYVAALAIPAAYALVNFLVYWFTAEKKYRNIEI